MARSTVKVPQLPVNAGMASSWLLSLAAANKAESTRNLYVRILAWFEAFLIDAGLPEGRPGDLLAVGRRDAEAWLAAMRAEGKKPTTVRNRWIGLRSFYAWLLDEEEIDVDPMAKVKVAKVDPDPIDVIAPGDIDKLIKACAGKGFLERRDTAIIRLFAATGMRLSELADLRVDDLDVFNRTAFIEHGKGDKARRVYFGVDTATALDRYLRVRSRHSRAHLDWLWLSRNGRFTDGGIPLMLERRCAEAGIERINPHRFRHSFADDWLARGGSEGDLQRIGGWQSAEVMRRYGSARADDRAADSYQRLMGDR